MHKDKIDRFWHSYVENPSIAFESQYPEENVALMVRAHPVTQVAWVLHVIFLLVLILLFDLFFPSLFTFRQLIIINIFSLFFIFSYAFYQYIHWFYNLGIITNFRVIDIDFISVLYKEVNMAKLDSVEDITSKGAGFLSSVFNYGHVFIQTAGSEVNIEFENIPNPSHVMNLIHGILKK